MEDQSNLVRLFHEETAKIKEEFRISQRAQNAVQQQERWQTEIPLNE